MKIAQLAPPWIRIPPETYGGTELVVSGITEELVKRGHEVTLFASGNSVTSARLYSTMPEPMGNSGFLKQYIFTPMIHCFECFSRAEQFDIIHTHMWFYAPLFTDFIKTPVIHTIHGSFDRNKPQSLDKVRVLERFHHQNFTSISFSQRKSFKRLNFVGNVYHGLNIEELSFSLTGQEYLFWMGRVTPVKGVPEVVNIAKRLNKNLILRGAIDPIDRSYFEEKVKPLLDSPKISFEEEVKASERSALYQNAKAFLFPINWEEPFGLVMIEAMSCGTPVVAFARGSVPEVIKDGETGFIVNSSEEDKRGDWIIKKTGIDGLSEAIERIYSMNNAEYLTMRQKARQHVENNFTVEKMVDGYERIYRKILGK